MENEVPSAVKRSQGHSCRWREDKECSQQKAAAPNATAVARVAILRGCIGSLQRSGAGSQAKTGNQYDVSAGFGGCPHANRLSESFVDSTAANEVAGSDWSPLEGIADTAILKIGEEAAHSISNFMR